MNVVILRGCLSRLPEGRLLPSGDHLVSYELTVARPGARAETVPVAWMEAPGSAADFSVGEEVVVVGRVRRRFFGRGGATQSRTEVAAERVLPARHKKRVRQAVDAALMIAREEGDMSTPMEST